MGSESFYDDESPNRGSQKKQTCGHITFVVEAQSLLNASQTAEMQLEPAGHSLET